MYMQHIIQIFIVHAICKVQTYSSYTSHEYPAKGSLAPLGSLALIRVVRPPPLAPGTKKQICPPFFLSFPTYGSLSPYMVFRRPNQRSWTPPEGGHQLTHPILAGANGPQGWGYVLRITAHVSYHGHRMNHIVAPQAKQPHSPRFCSECGSPLPPNAKQCDKCGEVRGVSPA